jgi:hypothetical protein
MRLAASPFQGEDQEVESHWAITPRLRGNYANHYANAHDRA